MSIATVGDLSLSELSGVCAQAISDADWERRLEFDGLLPHLLPHLRRIAMRWLRHPEDAEDAVQEAMLSAFRHLADFDGRSRMSTWLIAILHNAVRMQIRRRLRSRMVALEDDSNEGKPVLLETLADPRPTPERMAEQRELHELIRKLKSTLPRSQQAALHLRVNGGLSIKEAAEALGAPVGTVKAQLARGRASLTKRFHAAMKAQRAETVICSCDKGKRQSPFSDLTVPGKSPWRLIGSGVTF